MSLLTATQQFADFTGICQVCRPVGGKSSRKSAIADTAEENRCVILARRGPDISLWHRSADGSCSHLPSTTQISRFLSSTYALERVGAIFLFICPLRSPSMSMQLIASAVSIVRVGFSDPPCGCVSLSFLVARFSEHFPSIC